MELSLRQGRRLDDLDVLFEMTIQWADKTPSLVELVIEAAGEPGAHYGVQTLLQLLGEPAFPASSRTGA